MPQELNELPVSKNEYWKDSEVELIQLAPKTPCEHTFRHIKSMEVECIKCRAGYYLGPLDRLIDGHLYHNEQLVI